MRPVTVLATEWNVSAIHGTHIEGAILQVFKLDYTKQFGQQRVPHPVHDGKKYDNSDAAFDYAHFVGLTKEWKS